jgi:hypothetical protein
MSLAGRSISSRSRCSNQSSRSSGNRSDLTGPSFAEPLGRAIVPGSIVLVTVVEIRAVVRMSVLVDRAVVMNVAVRMLVGVARIGVVVGMQGAVIVLVGQAFFHGFQTSRRSHHYTLSPIGTPTEGTGVMTLGRHRARLAGPIERGTGITRRNQFCS